MGTFTTMLAAILAATSIQAADITSDCTSGEIEQGLCQTVENSIRYPRKPKRHIVPSTWLGISTTSGDGVQAPSPTLTLQGERFLGTTHLYEITAAASAGQRVKIETGDGYRLGALVQAQRWSGTFGPGIGLRYGHQHTSRWVKDAAWASAVLGMRLTRRAELTCEWDHPISGDGATTAVGVSAEVRVAGPLTLRASYSRLSYGSSVALAVGRRW